MADIHFYAERGDIQGVAGQLANGVSIEAVDSYGPNTPLMRAAGSDKAGADMIQFLVDHGADVNATRGSFLGSRMGENALHFALQSGSFAKTRALLNAGANVNYRLKSGSGALRDAVSGRELSTDRDLVPLLEELIRSDTDSTCIGRHGAQAVGAVSSIGRLDAVRVLLDAGAGVEYLQWTDLMFAVVFGEFAEVRDLLQAGADLTAQDHVGRTAWHLSLCIGDFEKAQLLFSAGAGRDAVDGVGSPALVHAVKSGNVKLVSWLIREGLDVNTPDRIGGTPLMYAAEHGLSDIVALLLSNRAIVNAVQEFEGTALVYAARANAVDCVRLLLEHGADPTLAPDYESTAMGETSSVEITR